jgi:hypothetical protein
MYRCKILRGYILRTHEGMYNLPNTQQTLSFNLVVLDRRSRILEVVIVRRLVTWEFGGGRDWERG